LGKELREPDYEFIRAEYSSLPALIAHWDGHFWQKSQFFFAVESVMLAAIGVAFEKVFLEGAPLSRPGYWVLIFACFFNFWLCYVWFRTNRSNREFLGPLFKRARDIERLPLEDDDGTFTAQHCSLNAPEHVRHSAHRWENHLPTGFALAWSAALVAGGFHSERWVGSLVALGVALIALRVIERVHPKRGSAPSGTLTA
jgi:hypothetical protein